MVVHGCEFWFNWGWPLTLLTIPVLLIIVIFHYSWMVWDMFFWPFKIIDISITDNKEFVMVYIKAPKGYKYRPGQYVFINVPSIKWFQWHPFSIASSPQNKHIIFMIKRNGDWTGKLIDWLFECKKEMLWVKKLGSHEEQDAIFKVLLDLDQESKVKELSKNHFPIIHLSRPITSAAETALYRKNIIMIGAGSGIAPYLSFIEDSAYFIHKICKLGDKKS